MPVKPSGEVKTKIIPVPQKNGDIYLMERKTQYDPEKIILRQIVADNVQNNGTIRWCHIRDNFYIILKFRVQALTSLHAV